MAANLPTIQRDCNNNLTHVSVGSMDVSFSYTTPVAFRYDGYCFLSVVSENVWSMTTGRHLNAIDGGDKRAKAKRVPHDLFVVLLDLIAKGDKASVTKAERLLNTHRALNAAGIKAAS